MKEAGVKLYHSRRTCSFSLVHVVEFAIAASTAGRPLVARSETTSAAQRIGNSDTERNKAQTAQSEVWPTILHFRLLRVMHNSSMNPISSYTPSMSDMLRL
jgi:hypothetical protein